MFNQRGLSKLKAILLIDIIIVAIAAGTYLYLTSSGMITIGLKPAEFKLTDLEIAPLEADAGEPVVISFNVTNVGESDGNYTVVPVVNGVPKENITLVVNDNPWDNQTVTLAPSESTLISFVDTESVEGNYTVQVGDLSGAFFLKPAPIESSNVEVSKLLATPYEGWVSDEIHITATVKNVGEAGSLGVKLSITSKDSADSYSETKRIDLGSGESTTVDFLYTAKNEGTFNVKLGTQVSGFVIVPNGYHNLLVVSAPKQGLDFKIDGKPYKTPHTELLTVGVPHTVEFPAADPTGKFGFLQWEPSSPPLEGDGSTNPSRQITLTQRQTVKGSFSGGSSCPSLYLWNGEEYVYMQEVSNHGWLGYTKDVYSNGSLDYWRNNPWDYIPLNKSQLQASGGYYLINLTQRWDEVFYLDSAYMLVVDHPADQNVYSTMTEQYIDPAYMGNIYTVSTNPLKPVSASNELVTFYNGKITNVYNTVDALSAITSMDGVYTTGFNGKYSQDWNNQTWNRLTLNLGNLTGAPQIKLVLRAIVNWGPADSYTNWMNKFYSTTVPDGTEPTPVPFMEVKDINGNWVRVPDSRQIPMPPDTLARSYVVDLTGLFPSNNYSLRINNFWNVTYDYIGIDTSPQQNLTIQKIDPQAVLRQEFSVAGTMSTGSFTRYGDVTNLLLTEDDKFVIGRQGDSVELKFPTNNLSSPALGMVRDYFFFVAAWFKVEYANYGFGPGHDGFTVDPLPFHNMSGFPYPLATESYPYDSAHNAYLQEFNTRVISPASQESFLPILIPAAAIIAIIAVDLGVLVRYRKRSKVTPP
ncbi:MAG TPA: CARDB domain-containing protein [Candidatus Sulfotelmatobacter sp.]|nr:CARDB domain-containing protein [Candidatus Sulfotelmatobacter sp.]